MATSRPPGRTNQRYRTRKDLLTAAALLMKQGRKPSLEEVAEAALVSRATAYRYFPDLEALLIEASLDIAVPDGDAVFAGDASQNAEERVEKAEAAMHRSVYSNEPAIRLMLASSIARALNPIPSDAPPLRQNRRTPLTEAALAPARGQFTEESYDRVRAALALVFGSEAMVVFRDVLRVDDDTARRVKGWAARALVRAALEESRLEDRDGAARKKTRRNTGQPRRKAV